MKSFAMRTIKKSVASTLIAALAFTTPGLPFYQALANPMGRGASSLGRGSGSNLTRIAVVSGTTLAIGGMTQGSAPPINGADAAVGDIVGGEPVSGLPVRAPTYIGGATAVEQVPGNAKSHVVVGARQRLSGDNTGVANGRIDSGLKVGTDEDSVPGAGPTAEAGKTVMQVQKQVSRITGDVGADNVGNRVAAGKVGFDQALATDRTGDVLDESDRPANQPHGRRGYPLFRMAAGALITVGATASLAAAQVPNIATQRAQGNSGESSLSGFLRTSLDVAPYLFGAIGIGLGIWGAVRLGGLFSRVYKSLDKVPSEVEIALHKLAKKILSLEKMNPLTEEYALVRYLYYYVATESGYLGFATNTGAYDRVQEVLIHYENGTYQPIREKMVEEWKHWTWEELVARLKDQTKFHETHESASWRVSQLELKYPAYFHPILAKIARGVRNAASGLSASEFTVGNVILMVLGAVIASAGIVYLALKMGGTPAINLITGLSAFLLIRAFLPRENPSAREANLVQTAMTTATSAAFMVTAVAALDMLGFTMSPLFIFLWLGTGTMLGALMITPLRRQYIVVEELHFPNGWATAEMLKDLENAKGSGANQTKALAISGALAAALTLLRDCLKVLPGALFANRYMMGLETSLLLFGSGVLIGLRTVAWALLASLIVWGLLAPLLVSSGIAAETANIFRMQEELENQSLYKVLMRWTMWPATALFVSHGLSSLLFHWKSLVGILKSLTRATKDKADLQEELSPKAVLIGVGLLTLLLAIIQFMGLGVSPWITLLAVLVSVPLMLVGIKVHGETGIGPVTVLASATQFLFPGSIATNMAASGTTGSIAAASQDLMDDMKTGHLVGNKPRSLSLVQLLIGIPIGALVTALVYPMLRDVYGFGENGLPAPYAHKWKGLAELSTQGLGFLPTGTVLAMAIAAVAGILFAALEKRWPKWTPSAVGIGIALLLPSQMIVPMALGGIAAWLFSKYAQTKSETYAIPVAAGFMVGETFMVLILAVLTVVGILK